MVSATHFPAPIGRRGIIALRLAAAGCLLIGLSATARAHFVWTDLAPSGEGPAEARVYFSETPAPGERHLIGKVAQTKAWTRSLTGQVAELKLAEAGAGGPAALVAPCDAHDLLSVEATCDYGVFERGPVASLLQYYAKHLADEWPRRADGARSERLRLDLSPRIADGKLEVTLLFDGKPDADRELVVHSPSGDKLTLKTDSEGRASWETAAGRWAIRAKHVESTSGGQRDGKSYAQTSHYSTLTLAAPAPTAAPAGAELTAAETLRQAREARAVWKSFPGFDASAVIVADNDRLAAKIAIDASGAVTIDAPASKLREWADDQLSSLAQHRMPAGEISDGEAKFLDDDDAHPLGRRIDLGDSTNRSVYRIRDSVITEVNRTMGKTRFTISMLEALRTPEGKYLPRAFTMSFFDAASGELKSSVAYWNDWQRVGAFELPKTILEIAARDGRTTTRKLELSEIRLRSPAPAGPK